MTTKQASSNSSNATVKEAATKQRQRFLTEGYSPKKAVPRPRKVPQLVSAVTSAKSS